MYTNLSPEFIAVEVRERHARLRRQATYARAFRQARGQHRYRSRQRRT